MEEGNGFLLFLSCLQSVNDCVDFMTVISFLQLGCQLGLLAFGNVNGLAVGVFLSSFSITKRDL